MGSLGRAETVALRQYDWLDGHSVANLQLFQNSFKIAHECRSSCPSSSPILPIRSI